MSDYDVIAMGGGRRAGTALRRGPRRLGAAVVERELVGGECS
jgi:pyruvate/2-oxoglutarate dehydrogenase complex dihydrolipoamide dehydrogenase (E3) component